MSLKGLIGVSLLSTFYFTSGPLLAQSAKDLDTQSINWLVSQIELGEIQKNTLLMTDSLDKLMSIAPNNVLARCAQARVYLALNNPTRAQIVIDQFSKLDNSQHCVKQLKVFAKVSTKEKQQVQKARLLAKAGQYQQAVKIYDVLFSPVYPNSEYEFEQNWENADFKNINFNWILKHSKMCNLKIHKELIKKYVYNDFYITSDVADSLQELSELVLPYLFKVLKYCNKKWISFNESTNLWTIDADPSKNIIDIINIGLSANIKYLTYKINNVDQANQSDFANKLKYIIAYKKRKDSSGYITSFKNYVHTMLEDNEFYLKLDSSKFQWFFKNGMLDLKTNEFREGIFYSDYVTKVLPYDYKPDIDIEKLNYVKQQFKKVCNNNQEHLDYYLSTIAYSLCNAPDEVKAFWIFVGELADNGKTKPLEALTKIFPCYIKKGNAQLIYESKSAKKHKFMGNISYRLLWIDELSRTEKLDTAFLKELADGGDINNEVMYGTESIIKNNCKLIVPSNWLPTFETDEGMKSRLKCMQFNSKFKQDTTIDNYEELNFVRDCNLMDKIVDCKYEVISLLREYVFSYINNNLPTMPLEFQETTNTTYELNDEFNAWIDDNCVMDLSFKLAKQDILKYSDFDKKDLFSNMKRLGFKYNKSGSINKKRGVFIGLKMKEDDCEME